MRISNLFTRSGKAAQLLVVAAVFLSLFFVAGDVQALTVNVVDGDGAPVSGFRWLVERDNTVQRPPGQPVIDGVTLNIHNSYAPVAKKGQSNGSSASIPLSSKRSYFVSVLPYTGYSLGGSAVSAGQGAVTVVVHDQPIPTAQISLLAFVDHEPINNAFDAHEVGLGDVNILVSDAGGHITQDAFGNPLGTRYNPDGSVAVLGNSVIKTLTQDEFDNGPNPDNLKVGEALIKNIPPGKYGIVVVPPGFDAGGQPVTWVQTSTIEGTPTVDAWVKANEPKLFIEGFGTGFNHVFYGFVKTSPVADSPIDGQVVSILPWNAASPGGTGSIGGTLRFNHFSRPPRLQGFFPGAPVEGCWVGLNDPLTKAGLYAAPCAADSTFLITGVPAGTYQLVWWDENLDALFGFAAVTVGDGEAVALGDVLAFRWFGTLKGKVFNDTDQDGFPDPGEAGLSGQDIGIRFRDGTIYQATVSDPDGEYELTEVFPFFKWLVPEVGFLNMKATGATMAIDYGGEIPAHNGWTTPSFGMLNPQPQKRVNPNTGNNLSRTETGAVLTEAMHLFLGQTNVIDFGKTPYVPGENGGISGIVFYAVTRAEDDPAFAAGEEWEPGIPRVQVNLYKDLDADGVSDKVPGGNGNRRADVNNFPYDNFPGKEDIDRNKNGKFDWGSAVMVTWTDSWNDDKPTGCIQDLPVVHRRLPKPCFDSFGTWNQVRPGIFDGGYALEEFRPKGQGYPKKALVPGTYIVEAVPPPGYELVKEEDKNVDWGDEYTQAPVLLPAPCVGKDHLVPPFLTLFPSDGIDAPYAGEMRPLCDRKQVVLRDGQNAAAEFFFFTEVPKAARAVGFTNNDLSAEFNMAGPNFGEKLSPSWIPVSFKDWAGNEVSRVYTDEFGGYNSMLPSTFTINAPTPTGVSPNMITLVLNDPHLPDGSIDPFYNPIYSVTPWTFHYTPGATSYLDTPLVPLAAFAAFGTLLDAEPADGTPVIDNVQASPGPLLCTDLAEDTITLRSAGPTEVPNPDYDPAHGINVFGRNARFITRDFGFGAAPGEVTLDGTALTIVSWNDDTIVAQTLPGATTGQVMVTRGDNGVMSEIGITLNIVDCTATTIVNVPGDFPTIQDAIDDAGTVAGSIIVVAEGTYNENVIMYKPVRLQGAGAGSTVIDGNPVPTERLQAWHERIAILGGDVFVGILGKDPFRENEAPAIVVFGENGGLNPGNPFDTPGQAAIDGFTLIGSKAGGGIFVPASAKDLTISNNDVKNNQGTYAGGISIGAPDTGFPTTDNDNIVIRYNRVRFNGGIQGAGGIAMNDGSNGYLIEGNIIIGNFSRFNGGGIKHSGLSGGENIIRDNQVLFNEEFFGANLAAAGDGGGIYIGAVAGDTGTGNVTIDGNLIQGNLSGSGRGGGIRAFAVNGSEVDDNPDNNPADPDGDPTWYKLTIINNIIANNVAGLGGGGISLQDVADGLIVNNTVVSNVSTSTSANAFQAGQPNSDPLPGGIESQAHSAVLQSYFGAGFEQTFSDPVLEDNIFWKNQSFFFDASLNDNAGGLAENPDGLHWDLGVTGTATPQYLTPTNSILSTLTAQPVFDYDSSNSTSEPRFVKMYSNDVEIATVIDEGGNAISTRFKPLQKSAGDYHLRPDSPAIDLGAGNQLGTVPALAADIDGEARPSGGVDSGADEFYAGTYAAVTLLTPNGGEMLPSGSVHRIYWGAPAEAVSFDLLYSLNNGKTWQSIATGVTGIAFDWTVPAPAKNKDSVLIRVIGYRADTTKVNADKSDAPLSIVVVTLDDPNASEILTGGGTHTILWTTNTTKFPVVRVKLEYSLNAGKTWRKIATVPGNPGTYDWSVPAFANLKRAVKARVTLIAAGPVKVGSDISDRRFVIRP